MLIVQQKLLIIVAVLTLVIGVVLDMQTANPADTREQERLEQEHKAIFQEPEIKF